MRLLPGLIIALIVCLVAIALPAAPAQAQCGIFIELSPEYGLPGTNVTVSGHGFAAGVLVDIYYDGTTEDDRIDTLTTGGNGDFTIVITIPEGCQGHHEVSARGKYASADTYFTVDPGLLITPENGPVGTTVAVEGKGFAKNEDGIELLYYYLNGDYKTVESNIIANPKGSWQTSFQVPLSTRGKHKIDADGAETKLYQVKDATFTVTAQISLDESSGFVGDPVTMTGSRFAAHEKGIQVLFDGQVVVTDIKADSEGEWEASFEVPEMPTGGHGVTAQGEQTSKEDVGYLSFEIKPNIVLSPTAGHVGTNLTVTGYGFTGDKDVSIMYDNSQGATATTDYEGNFEASFPVPPGQHGDHPITVGYSAADVASATFTLESVAPDTPQLMSPADRNRLGFTGNVTPTFQWSGVSDDSGVRYSLQIAASDTVTGTGEFADPVVSITGLVGTNYTLDKTKALSQGTYYWMVQAVDGAQNEGDWSTAYSFRVGLLPRWAFIAIIIAAVVLFCALIRALVRRRGIYYDRW
jgi:hypothetical protein